MDLEETTFRCFCNQKVIEADMFNHMKNCKQFSKESPLAKIFFELKLSQLQVSDLIGIKCEFLGYHKQFIEEIGKSNKLINLY